MWVIATLAGLVGLIILVLCVPLEAALNMDSSARPRFKLKLVWLFGLVSKELSRKKEKPEEKRKITREKPEEKKEPTKEKPKKKRAIGFSTILKILRTKGLPRQLKDLVKDVLGQFRIKKLAADCRLGLEDPADTGLIFALVGVTTPFLNLSTKYQLRVQPSFSGEPVFEGHLHGLVRLRPIGLSWPLLRFIFSLTMFRIVKTLVLSKWKRKKK